MNPFEDELRESAKIPVQPPEEDLDLISRFLIVLGFILWGVIIYMVVQAVHYGIIK